MALIPVISPGRKGVATGGGTNVSASDTFAAGARRFLLHYTNTSANPVTPVFDDPNTPSPADATTFNPDITGIAVPATTGDVAIVLDESDVQRLRDPVTGLITVNHTGSITANQKVKIFAIP